MDCRFCNEYKEAKEIARKSEINTHVTAGLNIVYIKDRMICGLDRCKSRYKIHYCPTCGKYLGGLKKGARIENNNIDSFGD